MNSTWLDFLRTQNTQLDESGHYFEPTTAPKDTSQLNTLVDLNHYASLAVIGPDADRLLQGQLSCDIKTVTNTTSQLGVYCTPKGRVICFFRIFRLNDGYQLVMPSELLDITRATLQKYIVFYKSSLHDYTDRYVHLGLSGDLAPQTLTSLFNTCPHTDNEVVDINSGRIVRISGTTQRFELWLEPEAAISLWPQLTQHHTIQNAHFWTYLDIQAGIADITLTMSEQFTPEVLNYTSINAVSFSKGCYTGQEVVARMHYLGKSKKHLFKIRVNSDQPLPLQCPLFSKATNAKAGTILRATPDTQGQIALAIINTKLAEQPLITENNQDIEILPLPYKLIHEQ